MASTTGFCAYSERKILYFLSIGNFFDLTYFVNSPGKTLTQKKISSRLTLKTKSPIPYFLPSPFSPRGNHGHQLGLQPSRHFYAFSYIVWFCKVLFYQYIKIIHIAPQYAFFLLNIMSWRSFHISAYHF